MTDERLRPLVLDACIRFLANPDHKRTPEINGSCWDRLASNAKSPAEQERIASARSGNNTRK
ncbi:MAG: hypothetical protein NTW21_29235 [Verrucomicrobia bacterium]|nr:hypothetical protein [Verrucomicrobiota bacterium]